FFQAEDGIRDFHVTGVQTCALPIYWFELRHGLPQLMRGITAGQNATTGICDNLASTVHCATHLCAAQRDDPLAVAIRIDPTGCRSEERRVGKEGRTAW